jgi:hypothetical protein
MFRLPSFARPSPKKFLALAVAATVLAVSGIAYAAWTSSAVGPGRAASGTAVELTVTAATGAADLFTGTTQGEVFFTVTNTNPYSVTFTSMTPGPAAITSSDATACPPTNVTLVGKTGLSLTVAANTTSPTLSIADVVSMALAAPDGCQAKTFEIPMTLTGASV